MQPLLNTRFEADAERYAERMATAGRRELDQLLHRLFEQERRLKARAEDAAGDEARTLRALIAECLKQQKECRRLMRRKR